MKRLSVLFICLLLVLTGCSSPSTAEGTNAEKPVAGVHADKGVFTVEVTLGASFFTDKTDDEIKAASEEAGYSDCKINDDGSVTYTMSKKKHEEALAEMKDRCLEIISQCLSGENKVNSFTDIQHNENFSEFNILVNAEEYNIWDTLYAQAFYFAGAYYQGFAGVPGDEIDVIVNFVDNATQEVLNTASYKKYISNLTENTATAETQGTTTEIGMNESVVIEDVCEFYVEHAEITDDVMPPKPGHWYTHYEADDGKIYVDVCIAYKNLSTKPCAGDKALNATLTYGKQYQYPAYVMLEKDSRGDFAYANITAIAPLSTEYIHCLFALPEEAAASTGALDVVLKIDGNAYSFIVREGTEGDVASLHQNAQAKSSGKVKEGEIIAIPNECEFFIDYVDITDDVLPPNPANWYTHFAAGDGKVFVDFCIGYKNWHDTAIMANKVLSAKLIYDGKYEYSGSSIIEKENRGNLTYSNITSITPLNTEYVHYLFEVPEEVEDHAGKLEISFTIAGNTYSYTAK